jgi:hypothetical protein
VGSIIIHFNQDDLKRWALAELNSRGVELAAGQTLKFYQLLDEEGEQLTPFGGSSLILSARVDHLPLPPGAPSPIKPAASKSKAKPTAATSKRGKVAPPAASEISLFVPTYDQVGQESAPESAIQLAEEKELRSLAWRKTIPRMRRRLALRFAAMPKTKLGGSSRRGLPKGSPRSQQRKAKEPAGPGNAGFVVQPRQCPANGGGPHHYLSGYEHDRLTGHSHDWSRCRFCHDSWRRPCSFCDKSQSTLPLNIYVGKEGAA